MLRHKMKKINSVPQIPHKILLTNQFAVDYALYQIVIKTVEILYPMMHW